MSGNEGERVLYWDSCIYLAWLKGEDNGASVNDGIAEAADDNLNGKLLIVTSTITFVEVLAATLTADQEAKFRQSFRKQFHSVRDLDPPVAMKARNFREAFLGGIKKLATPDAVHLATASIYKADEVWTIDDGGKDRKFLGMLELTGNAGVDSLVIRRPFARNMRLPGVI